SPSLAVLGGGEPVNDILGMPLGDDRFFDVYDLEPLAGRLLSEDRGADSFTLPTAASPVVQTSVVLSESALPAFRFPSAKAALGETLVWALPDARVEYT